MPDAATVQEFDAGWTPGAHISFQEKLWPVAYGATATPLTFSVLAVSGANQSGESIAAIGGILPLAATAVAAPRSTRPQPKCEVHWRSGVAQAPCELTGVSPAGQVGGAIRSGAPIVPPFGVVARSAVCSRISRVSSGVRAIPCSSAALITSAAAPEALPVFCEPVVPSIEIELWPPY